MALVETTVWPETIGQWLAIIALGVGPVGAAFFAWDIGMKRGDIRVLGAASYATPLLSTAFLILAGFAKPSATIAIAAILIAGGGLIAAKDMVWKNCRMAWSAAMPIISRPRATQTVRCANRALRPCIYEAMRLPILRRQFEFRKVESGRDGAADQRPVAGAFGRLPGMRRHDRLRRFAGSEVGAEPDAALPAVIGDLQRQRAAGVIMPDLHRIDAMPVRALAARQQEIDRGRSRAPVGVDAADRETSRDNARLPDAASVRAAR